MIVIGVVLLILAVLASLGVSLYNGGEVSGVEVFGVSVDNVSVGGLFIAGVITGIVGALGLGLILSGLARKRHKKVAVKRQVKSARTEAETLAEENARLQEQLERERNASASTARPVADDRVAADRGAHDRTMDDRGAHDRTTDDRGAHDRTVDDRTADDRGAHGRTVDDRTMDDRQAFDDRTVGDRPVDSGAEGRTRGDQR